MNDDDDDEKECSFLALFLFLSLLYLICTLSNLQRNLWWLWKKKFVHVRWKWYHPGSVSEGITPERLLVLVLPGPRSGEQLRSESWNSRQMPHHPSISQLTCSWNWNEIEMEWNMDEWRTVHEQKTNYLLWNQWQAVIPIIIIDWFLKGIWLFGHIITGGKPANWGIQMN